MLRNLPLFIGLRYISAKRRNHFISFISLSSMLGIALGVTVLITVLSVMNGFERELRERILGVTPHVTVSDLLGPLKDWPALRTQMESLPAVAAAVPYISVQGIISRGQSNRFALVNGIDPAEEGRVSRLPAMLDPGVLARLESRRFGIVLGAKLAQDLEAKVGEKLAVMTPDGNGAALGSATTARVRLFEVLGTFKVGAEMDGNLALVHIRDAAVLANLGPDEVSGLRLKLHDLFEAPVLAAQLRNTLDGYYYTGDWTRTLGNLFAAIQMNKRQMFLLLMLIIAVAAFNIVSTLVMTVTDKRSDIAILRTLGASPRTIMGIFVVQGAANGVLGTLLGLAGGISLALNISGIVEWIQGVLGVRFLDAEVYFIDFLPAELAASDLLLIAAASLTLCLLATIYPAWRAARVQPAEALRYD